MNGRDIAAAALAAARIKALQLDPAKPVAIARQDLNHMSVHEQFQLTHKMSLTAALNAGLVTITDAAPDAPPAAP